MPHGPGRGSLRRVVTRGRVVWEGTWRDGQGRRKRIYLGNTKAEAEVLLAQKIHERDLELAGMTATRGLEMSLELVEQQYAADLGTRAEARSIKDARLAFQRFRADTGARVVRDVTVALAMQWRQARSSKGAANKTLNTSCGYLSAGLELAVRMGQLATNPLASLQGLPTTGRHQKRHPRALSDWEIGRLLAAGAEIDREARKGIPREPLLRALILTGARWSELISTTWGDLDAERAVLTLRAETTKTSRERVIPLDRGLLETLLELPALVAAVKGARPRPTERIFLAPRGRPWPKHTGGFADFLDECLERSGVDPNGVSTHSLRHTFITRLARNGVSVASAQYLAGHATPTMTLRVYSHLRAEEARGAIDNLPPLGSTHDSENRDARKSASEPGRDVEKSSAAE